jgi:glycosyltransferase involved in cell wall biosynthesis
MKRVLVFNFFGGLMDRGIPLYASDIVACMRRVGLHPVELCCPRWLHRTPRALRNLMFVIFEQLVAPLVRVLRRCSVTIYPYNSAGLVDAALGRSVVVIHDFIGHGRSNGALAARYVRSTQAVHRALGRQVCAASVHTLRHARRLPAFSRCSLRLWTNPFYSFEEALTRFDGRSSALTADRPRVLLCSGIGRNKDYRGALKLFITSAALRHAELRIIGFGTDARLARRWVEKLPIEFRRRITVLPRLTLQQVVAEYSASDLVWVHSLKEGFGRSVVEARLSGRPVIASDIGAFRKLKGEGVFLYRKRQFDECVRQALHSPLAPRSSTESYHRPLETAVREVTARYFRAA